MEEISKKQLPYDVVESILSRLPVKSLLRFKSVSKSWAATISDQRFAVLHLRQSRQSSGDQDIFFLSEYKGYGYMSTNINSEKLELFQTKTKFPLERKLDPSVLCYCDALALRRYPRIKDKKYVLCNLSIGTHTEFSCPYPIFYNTHRTVYGICYDPSINDYKVVVVDNKHYAVYHCRSKCWSEMKATNKDGFSWGRVLMGKGVSLNGHLYFVLRAEEDCGRIKIVGFDPSREKFIEYPKPKYTTTNRLFMYLTCLGGYLYLCFNDTHSLRIKVRGGVADDDDDEEVSWMEFDDKPPFSEVGGSTLHSCDIEDETALGVCDTYTTMGYYRIPYVENLFISGPKQVIKKRR